MKKLHKKITLRRETLRHLQSADLRRAAGGDSFQFGCESGSCPVDCGTATDTCPPSNTCASAYTNCGPSCLESC